MAESVPQLGQQPHHYSTNWTQCIVCQKPASNKTLVLHPRIDSYQHLFNVVLERAQLQDSKFIPIQKRLKDYTAEILQREVQCGIAPAILMLRTKPWYNVHVATYKNISLVEPIGSQDECQ